MSEQAPVDPGELEPLLDYVRGAREFDFSGYKRPTLVRRIGKRMAEVGCETYGAYQDYLEVHPDEFVTFFNTILINVTSFFRDPQAWEFVADELVPRIISGKDPGAPIRIWSAGCASGEEAFTLAIVFCEALGDEPFRARVKIYGTDVDEEALAEARLATYPPKALELLSDDLRDRYFERSRGAFTFRNDLRRSVVFGRHDLMRDAPISRLDLLSCRNTLMYFNAEAQSVILDRFRFALEGGGYLFLGRAETLLSHSSVFRPLQLKLRVFESVSQERDVPPPAPVAHILPEPEWPRAKLRDAAFNAGARAMLVVDADGVLQSFNASARSLFDLTPEHLGRSVQDLGLSYRPLELRSVIEEAYGEHAPVERRGIEWLVGDNPLVFDVIVTPLYERASGATAGISVTFEDVTRYRALEAELEVSSRELQTAYEELQSTNEELETINEELQSTNEELQSTNEELQSTNEELETMNEELQSTSDEFQVVNEMLNARGEELNQANTYLQSVLGGIDSGVIVVDEELVVRVWNHRSEDLWGVRADEVEGKRMANLELGLPVSELLPAIRGALDGAGDRVLTVSARDRRGRDFACSVRCSPMRAGGRIVGIVVLMDDDARSGD